MKILFLSNIPSPYRVDFFNELGKIIDLKVIFEAERNYDLNKKWYNDTFENFECIFLKKGKIEERKINWKILKYIKRKNQDLIIVTNYSYFTELVALLYIKLKRIPYCMEVDGGIIKSENIILKYIKKFLIKGAKAYISPSKATDDFLIHYGAKRNKIYRYPFTSVKKEEVLNKVLNKQEKLYIKNKLGIREDKIIISVGQFIPRKGYDILLNACRYISSDIGIYIVGGVATKEYIKIKRDFNLRNVNFIEFKSKEELKEYYKIADLFVLPTREDIWGLVINEAMAFGLPIITTNNCIAGLELVKNGVNGQIVAVEDEKELAYQINNIIWNNILLDKMSNESLKKIKKYTIENMVLKHIDIFNKILGE